MENESELKLHDTSVEMKMKHFDKWCQLVRNQWEYGGVKYAENQCPGSREATDLLTEGFGLGGMLWTMGKYLLRFRNLRREKDVLKFSCYGFILWLKMGFFMNESHDEDVGKK